MFREKRLAVFRIHYRQIEIFKFQKTKSSYQIEQLKN